MLSMNVKAWVGDQADGEVPKSKPDIVSVRCSSRCDTPGSIQGGGRMRCCGAERSVRRRGCRRMRLIAKSRFRVS